MTSPILAAIKVLFTLSYNHANKQVETNTFYAGVENHLLWCYDTNAVITKGNEEISNFKEGSLTPWEYFQKL